jgi:hypothetical protein
MRPVLLLARNYLREQKVFLIVLSVYLVLGTGWLAVSSAALQVDDLSFLIKQQAEYAIVFGLFMTSGAIFADRKSRRVLLVLAKGIDRGQYLAGIYLGTCIALIGYLSLSWLSATILLNRMGLPLRSLTEVILAAGVATLLSSAIALFYSTMMHPVLAVAAAVLTMAVPHAMARVVHPGFDAVLPAYAISNVILGWNPGQMLVLPAYLLVIGLAEVGAFLVLAALAFRGRDLALSVD